MMVEEIVVTKEAVVMGKTVIIETMMAEVMVSKVMTTEMAAAKCPPPPCPPPPPWAAAKSAPIHGAIRNAIYKNHNPKAAFNCYQYPFGGLYLILKYQPSQPGFQRTRI
jgi:hypothetical protein